MKRWMWVISIFLLTSGCTTLPSKKSSYYQSLQKLNEEYRLIREQQLKIEKRQKDLEANQKEILGSIKEILKMLSEIYNKGVSKY